MRLHWEVKFRSFGITFGTVKGNTSVTGLFDRVIEWALSFVKGVPDDFSFDAVYDLVIAGERSALFNDRGVYLYLTRD